MKTKGHIYLKVSGIFEIIIGAATLALVFWLLSLDPSKYVEISGIDVKAALSSLMWIYISAGAQVIGGFIGVISANKPERANLCKTIGCILVIVHFIGPGRFQSESFSIVSQYITLVIPCAYVLGAMLNAKK